MPARARGFHLSLKTNAGVTFSQPNFRQLQFGIDQNRAADSWTDCGRPGNALLAFAMCSFDGHSMPAPANRAATKPAMSTATRATNSGSIAARRTSRTPSPRWPSSTATCMPAPASTASPGRRCLNRKTRRSAAACFVTTRTSGWIDCGKLPQHRSRRRPGRVSRKTVRDFPLSPGRILSL